MNAYTHTSLVSNGESSGNQLLHIEEYRVILVPIELEPHASNIDALLFEAENSWYRLVREARRGQDNRNITGVDELNRCRTQCETGTLKDEVEEGRWPRNTSQLFGMVIRRRVVFDEAFRRSGVASMARSPGGMCNAGLGVPSANAPRLLLALQLCATRAPSPDDRAVFCAKYAEVAEDGWRMRFLRTKE